MKENKNISSDQLLKEFYRLPITILPQPNNTTCGPTCLQAVYHYYKDPIDLHQLIQEVHAFEGGGTLAVWLACHALKRGYEATIYTYNLQVYDPSWFGKEKVNLIEKLQEQMDAKVDPKLILASRAYMEFFELGGTIKMEDLTRELLRKYLKQNIPILAGLNANFLYRSPREFGPDCEDDDIRGEPAGHFVIICGYDQQKQTGFIADPFEGNPYSPIQLYEANLDRIICSILIGVLTYDANFLIIRPK